MERSIIRLDQTVQEVLSEWHETQKAFRAMKTSCIGCWLARFCSLRDVSEAYKISPDVLMDAIEQTILEIQTKERNNP